MMYDIFMLRVISRKCNYLDSQALMLNHQQGCKKDLQNTPNYSNTMPFLLFSFYEEWLESIIISL